MAVTHLELDLPAAPDEVFDHLTDAALLERWWATSGETDPQPGGVYRLHFAGPGVTLRGVFGTVDRPTRLSYSWSWDHERSLPGATPAETTPDDVVFELEPIDGGTRLTLRHTARSEEAAEEHLEGWTFFLGRLRDLLAGAPG